MYRKLFQLKKNNKALWNGAAGGQLQRVLTTNNPAIFAFVRQKDECKVFAVFNLTNQEQTITLQSTLYPGNYRNVFTDDSVTFSENAVITLPAWGYKVYEIGSGISEVYDEKYIPNEYNLLQNYPNPFNPTTNIQYSLREAGFVTIKIFDILGREIATLVNEEKSAGIYVINFDSSIIPSGIYFYQIQSGNFIETKKMVLSK